jgi:hypothetical protein
MLISGVVRAEVAVNVPVNLVGRMEMPPRAGKIVQYDWYLGGSDYAFEPTFRRRVAPAVPSPSLVGPQQG